MSDYPNPTGYEVITINNTIFTLGQIINLKKKVTHIIENAQNIVTTNVINNNNLINFAIIYELNQYSDIIQPINLLDFFTYILNLLNPNSNSKKTLSINKFNKLNTCIFENIHLYYSNNNQQYIVQCLICTDKFKNKDKIIILPCEHNFHKKCLQKWLTKESNKCPLCKTEIT